MLLAMNEQGKKVYAHQAEKSISHFCPACQSPLILKRGKLIQAHFSHHSKSNCSYFSESETQEHLEGKQVLFDWLKPVFSNIELEAYLADLQQRPDLFFEDEMGEKICLEFQCSPIATLDMLRRTENYLGKGYRVYWILGKKLSLQQGKITNLQKLFMLSIQGRLLFLHLDVSQKILQVSSYFHYSQKGKHQWMNQYFKLDKDHPCEVFLSQGNYNLDFSLSHYLYKHEKYMKESQTGNSRIRPAIEKFYQNRHYLQTYPHYIYQDISYEWMIQQHPLEWKYACLEWIKSRPLDDFFQTKDFLEYCGGLSLSYFAMPLIESNLKNLPFLKLLHYLEKVQVISFEERKGWKRLKKLESFNSEKEKCLFLQSLD